MSETYRAPIQSDHSTTKYDDGLSAAEKQHIERAPAESDNPFGDEEYAEVRYRTLHWWFVIQPSKSSQFSNGTLDVGNVE